MFGKNTHPNSSELLVLINSCLVVLMLSTNNELQAFCRPTNWAMHVIDLCFANTIVYHILQKTKLAAISSFISGVSFCLLVYCVIFLEHMNLWAFIFIFFLAPHFLALQLFWKNVVRPVQVSNRKFFLLAVAFCLATSFFIGQSYKKAIHSIEQFKTSGYQELDKNFMTEKILGMHFIYHTRYCEYDGWRPPKHEPILVIGMWLNNRYDPLDVDLKTRLNLYKKFFPNKTFKFDCSCGRVESDAYHRDALWKN